MPRILWAIWRENRWLEKAITQYEIDAVISDNRFGMYSKRIPSVYITHQLLIKTGNRFSERILQQIHYRVIQQYRSCWVPDNEENGLAGELSHPEITPANIVYLGPLSRFELMPQQRRQYEILVSLSGPEPQRTIFENKMLSELSKIQKRVLLVRGLPGEESHSLTIDGQVRIVNHLSPGELNEAFQQAGFVICRSGYTSIMDLVKLGQNAVLVPTPGQPEQEYLAAYLSEKKYFYSVEQSKFSLEAAIKNAATGGYQVRADSMTCYKKHVNEFVQTVEIRNFAAQ